MTENNIPVWGQVGRRAPGAAGWVHEDHFEVQIVDPETDLPVPTGEMGEIVVRPKIPFGFMAGYFNAPHLTVEAWRNLWFHTGDAGIMDETGLMTFVDRMRDCIRRRGHNISCSEIEDAVASISSIKEVSAYPVSSDIAGGEDEIMLAVIPHDYDSFDVLSVANQVRAILPRFAQPRYVKTIDEFPKTATGKIQRSVLSKQGVNGSIDLESQTLEDRIT